MKFSPFLWMNQSIWERERERKLICLWLNIMQHIFIWSLIVENSFIIITCIITMYTMLVEELVQQTKNDGCASARSSRLSLHNTTGTSLCDIQIYNKPRDMLLLWYRIWNLFFSFIEKKSRKKISRPHFPLYIFKGFSFSFLLHCLYCLCYLL